MEKTRRPGKRNEASSAYLSIRKAFGILELLAERSPQGVTEIAQALALEKSSVSRLLKSLSELGYVVQGSKRGQYQVSARLVTLAQQYLGGDRLTREAGPVLRRLAQEARSSAHLAVLVDGEMVIVAKESSPDLIQVATRVGGGAPLHASAMGKILLAGMAPEELDAALARPLERFTDKTLTDPRKLRRNLEEVRRKGCSFESEEEHVGVGCIGAPVVDSRGRWIAALSIAGPLRGTSFRLDAAHVKRLVEKAAELSELVGP
ncbi:MAG: IclR family transcriptional regulator [Planctomycetes bacterium]|nr:IclR family transcriptional regulator [Planctomycetota bacterium]